MCARHRRRRQGRCLPALGFALVVLAAGLPVAGAPASAAPPGPAVSVADAEVVEPDSSSVDLVFDVTLTNPTGRQITVSYATSDGTATRSVDYQPRSGQVVFNKRETSKQIRVPVLGDTVHEGDETLTLTLSSPGGGAVIGDGQATGTIRENDPQTQSLTVSRDGTGSGKVTSQPAGIDCGSDCSEDYPTGTAVTLTATPADGSTFSGWSGACTGSGTCTVTVDAARSVTATFDDIPTPLHTLSVSKAGGGTGSVSSQPAGIDCGSDCTEDYLEGTVVTLTATPVDGSTFAGWSGACTGTGTCQVTMDADSTATATFAVATPPVQHQLAVTVDSAMHLSWFPKGSVTSSPSGISCTSTLGWFGPEPAGDCTENYPQGQTVTLTATPGPVVECSPIGCAETGMTSTFTGWGGACTHAGTNPTCTLTMDAAKNATATFGVPAQPQLSVTVDGASDGVQYGTGSVTSSPAGISCAYTHGLVFPQQSGDCTETYTGGQVVTLTATPGSTGFCLTFCSDTGKPSTFKGWGGACAHAGVSTTCQVTMTQSRDATATFGVP